MFVPLIHASDVCWHCSQLDPQPLGQALAHGGSKYMFAEQMNGHKGKFPQAVLPVGQTGPLSSEKFKAPCHYELELRSN